MTMPFPELPLPAAGWVALPHLGLIKAEGEDAASFLHNQLTQDVLLLQPGQARWAAWCNAKGRMQASLVVSKRSANEIWLVCRQDLLAQTLKRLSMFVLRAKVKLSDASAQHQMLGLVGSAVTAAHPHVPWQCVHDERGAQQITLYPALGQPRALWIAPLDHPVPPGESLTAAQWAYGEVMSGIAWVEPATFEAFVPQMLNYESVDGVNFKKGCYPGQEVVARSQFRGTLKRRAYLVRSSVALTAGDEVFSAADPSQPCGLIAQAASLGEVHVAVAELQVQAAQAADLHWRASDGPALQLLPLPYALRDDL